MWKAKVIKAEDVVFESNYESSMSPFGRGLFNPAAAVKLETQSLHLPDM